MSVNETLAETVLDNPATSNESTAGFMVGNDVGDDVVASGIPEHIETLLQPVSAEIPVGQDPHDGDAFYYIKKEIDKLAGNDFPEVLKLTQEVLQTEGKDLRVAGYYLLASTYINGTDGLYEGICLYKGLLERYGRYCFPAKDQARRTAISWLNNKRLAAYVDKNIVSAKREQLNAISDGVKQLNEQIIEILGDDHVTWTSLNGSLKKAIERIQDVTPSAESSAQGSVMSSSDDGPAITNSVTPVSNNDIAITQANSPIASGAQPTPMPVIDSSIGSEQAFLQNVRALMGFLNDAGDLMRGAALARAVQWGSLKTPPHEGGRTRLPAPRAAGVAEIKNLLIGGNYHATWQLCEGMLFEPGCHVLLDLQWFAYQAAKGLHRADVAALIAAETGALLRRLPDLARCRFEDDTPFAQPETQRWLTDLTGSKTNVGVSQDEQDARIDQRVAEAQEVAQEKSLADGLALLADTLTLDTRGQFRLRLEMAVLCLDHQRADLALPVLDELTHQAQQTCLATWDKSLAMSLASHHQDALRLLMSKAGEHEKGVFAERINKLAADMCKADLVQAAQVL